MMDRSPCPPLQRHLHILNTRHLFRASFHLHFFWLRLSLFFFFLPQPPCLRCTVLARVPPALEFKPLRASFPSSKSFKAECVRKAVFRGGWVGGGGWDQSRTEIGTDREQEWTLQEEVFDLDSSPLCLCCPTKQLSRGLFSLWGKDTSLYRVLVISHKCCRQHQVHRCRAGLLFEWHWKCEDLTLCQCQCVYCELFIF